MAPETTMEPTEAPQRCACCHDILPADDPPTDSTGPASHGPETLQTTRLETAIQQNDAAEVQRLLAENSNLLNAALNLDFPHAGSSKRLLVTPIIMAAAHVKGQIVEILRTYGADINAGIGDAVQTALHLAADYGWGSTLELVLSLQDVEVDQANKYGSTALHLACCSGNLAIVTRLLNAGADISRPNNVGNTPFHITCITDRLDILKELWSRQQWSQQQWSRIYDRNMSSNQLIHIAAIKNSSNALHWLLEMGVNTELQGERGLTPLQLACGDGSLEVARILLDHGANVNAKINGANSPVQLACLNVHPNILDMLVGRGLLISDADSNGNTCFHEVVSSSKPFTDDHREVLRYLTASGADINKPNMFGFTPLYMACIKEKPDLVKCLLDLGADANKKATTFGTTALMEACCKSTTKTVEILLEKDADMSIENHHGFTALTLACRSGRLEHVKALVHKGAKVACHDRQGHTPLCTAAFLALYDVVLELLKTPAYYPKDPIHTKAFTETPADIPKAQEGLLKGLTSNPPPSLDTLYTIMYWAVANGCPNLARECIKSNREVLKWRREKATWLHIASQHGQTALIPIVSEAGVSAVAVGKITAMHLAAEEGAVEVTKHLLEIIGRESPSQMALARVKAIVKRNARDQSPLAISIQQKHKELTALFWSQIKGLGTTNKELLGEKPDEASPILEMVAQFEKPGNEETLRHLLREWCSQPPPIKDPEDFTTLEWAVHSSQPAVVWWLLSNGAYTGHVVEEAKKLATTRTGGVEELIQELLQHPPPIQDHVANPNDDQPPKLPKPADDADPSLNAYGTIVDIFSDGRVTSIRSPYPTIRHIIYDSGPDALMNDHMSLHQRHLDKLKSRLKALQPHTKHHGPCQVTSDTPRPEYLPLTAGVVPQDETRKNKPRTDRTAGDLQVRWIHIPATEMHLMRDLVSRLSNDCNRSEMDHRVVMRHFNRSWTELAAGAGRCYMKPQCMVDSTIRPRSESSKSRKPQERTPCTALYMPYLTMATYTPKHSNGASEKDASPHGEVECDPNGPGDLEESIQSRNSRQITHKPLTLDQYYYPVLSDTDARDNDQVLSKFLDQKRQQTLNTNGESKSEDTDATINYANGSRQTLQKEILVVDQLWIWIIDEKTIITATTENDRPDEQSPSSLLQTVLDNMIYGESRSRFERPTSVHSMMELILGVATGFFMKKFVPVPGQNRKGPLEIFLESIRDVANEETRLFNAFRQALEDEESQRDELTKRPGQTPSVKQMPQNPYHIISPETVLLNKIRDIRDELRMLRSLAEDQAVVWKQAFDSDDLKGCLQYYHPCTPTDVKKDLDDMVFEAEVTNNSINTLLDLRQKQASIKEAEFGRIQANDSARQSNSVFIFTVITIVFLPLSFLSSLFALDVSSFPHESGDVKYKGWWLFPILFGVTAIVSIPAIILAWNVNAISDWLQPRKQGAADSHTTTKAAQNEVEVKERRKSLMEEVWKLGGQRREGNVLPRYRGRPERG